MKENPSIGGFLICRTRFPLTLKALLFHCPAAVSLSLSPWKLAKFNVVTRAPTHTQRASTSGLKNRSKRKPNFNTFATVISAGAGSPYFCSRRDNGNIVDAIPSVRTPEALSCSRCYQVLEDTRSRDSQHFFDTCTFFRFICRSFQHDLRCNVLYFSIAWLSLKVY